MSALPGPMTPERQLLMAEISEFNAAYARCIDDDQLEQWPEFFAPDCVYRILPRENADLGLPAAIMLCDNQNMLFDRVVALRKANIYPQHYSCHILGSPVVSKVAANEILAQTSYVLMQTRMDGKTHIYSAGKYVDEFTRIGKSLRLKRRDVIFDTHRIETVMATPI